jgi:phage recombination protein Bet
MSTALTKHEDRLPAMQMSEAELLEVLQSSLYPGASLASIKMVLGYCKASGLDPMQKPVHIVPMWDAKAKQMRDVVMPGIGLYRTQAARTGCAGVTEPEFGPDVTEVIGNVHITYPAWCRVTVKRKLAGGDIVEFTAKEFWKENYAVKGGPEKSIAPNAMWQKRPYGQIAKCAEAQALRKAFPEIGSEPTADEMVGKVLNEYDIDTSTGEVVQQKPAARPALPDYSQADFDKNLPQWRGIVQSGRKTPDELIAMVSTKGMLTDAMKQAMRDLSKSADVTDVQPKNTAPAEPAMTAAEQAAHDEFLAGLEG